MVDRLSRHVASGIDTDRERERDRNRENTLKLIHFEISILLSRSNHAYVAVCFTFLCANHQFIAHHLNILWNILESAILWALTRSIYTFYFFFFFVWLKYRRFDFFFTLMKINIQQYCSQYQIQIQHVSAFLMGSVIFVKIR